jgi:predicted small lipoprotein YifL
MSHTKIAFNILLITLVLSITGCGQKPEIKEPTTGKIQKEENENPKKSHTTFNLHWDEKKMKI